MELKFVCVFDPYANMFCSAAMCASIIGSPSMSYGDCSNILLFFLSFSGGSLLECHENWSCLNMPRSNARLLMMSESSWLCPVLQRIATHAFWQKKLSLVVPAMGFCGYQSFFDSLCMIPCLIICSTYMDLGDWLWLKKGSIEAKNPRVGIGMISS